MRVFYVAQHIYCACHSSLDAAAIDAVVSSFIHRVTGEFRIQLDEPPPRVVPPLRLRIERGEQTQASDCESLGAEIISAMKERLKFTPAIEWLEPFALERSSHKTKFIEIQGKS